MARWRERVPIAAPRGYVVALTSDPATLDAAKRDAPITHDAVQELLDRRPQLLLDGTRPTPEGLAERLRSFWLPDEVVLYIGLAGTSLQRRVRRYYSTELGARRPHAGGWPLNSLAVLDELFVHFAPCPDPAAAEYQMLAAFSAAVSEGARRQLHDPDLPIPFANLDWPRGRHNRHGIDGSRESTRGSRTSVQAPRAARGRSSSRERVSSPAIDAVHRTQRITDADIRGGRVRIRSDLTMELLPVERGEIAVELRGQRLTCRWDPRGGGDRQRSEVISIGRHRAARLLTAEDVLEVSKDGDTIRLA